MSAPDPAANPNATKEPIVADLKTIQISGVNFDAPFKYAAGHVLTEVEAKALNQTRFENLRNNFAKQVKDAGITGDTPTDELKAKFAEYEAAYDFATPGTGTGATRLDPIEKEAVALARDIVKQALAAKGRSYNPPKDATDEQKEAYKASIAASVESVAAKDEVIAQAKKNVAARAKSIDAITAGLDL
jgi:hypothetical protein